MLYCLTLHGQALILSHACMHRKLHPSYERSDPSISIHPSSQLVQYYHTSANQYNCVQCLSQMVLAQGKGTPRPTIGTMRCPNGSSIKLFRLVWLGGGYQKKALCMRQCLIFTGGFDYRMLVNKMARRDSINHKWKHVCTDRMQKWCIFTDDFFNKNRQ